jgi:hypothetical protein
MSPTRRQVDNNNKSQAEHIRLRRHQLTPSQADTAPAWEGCHPWGSPLLPPAPMPIPLGKRASSTPLRHQLHSTDKASMALAPTRCRWRTASCCSRSPCPSPPSAHRRAAGSCARDSRLTHRPRCPAPRHCIHRREHASLSMSPVRGGGVELVSARARARRGISGGGVGRGRGVPAASSTVRTSGRRGSGAGPACGGRRAGRPRLGVWLA